MQGSFDSWLWDNPRENAFRCGIFVSNDFLPSASIETLRRRAEIVRCLRRFFDDRGFFEVETPLLSHDTVVDRYIDPVGIPKSAVVGNASIEGSQGHLWMQTSPEFSMKRMITGGADAIYQIAKCFRKGEKGARHNPEFTMLEWYRSGDDLKQGMELLAELVETTLERPKSLMMSYRETFKQFAGLDPFEASVDDMKSVVEKNKVAISDSGMSRAGRDEWLNLILSEVVEQHLGVESPVIVYDWPATQSALAIVRPEDSPVAERFEIYVDGVELANGYHELLDPDELARRNSINNQGRLKDGSQLLPEASRLLDAMRFGMPQCAGVALGVDRLVMLATGAQTIDEVIAFPIDRA